MSLHRQLNSEGIRHANADSATHERHVRQRKEKFGVEWIPAVAPEENPSSVFKLRAVGLGLGNGVYFTGFAAKEKGVTGKEFEKSLSAINWERRWNFGKMKRGDKICTVRRKRKDPAVGETVVNLAPWQMSFVNRELELWEQANILPETRKAMLLGMLDSIRQSVVDEFHQATEWDIVGSYIHLDSNKIHFGVVHSRVSHENELIGEKYLRTVGPWSVAQGRIHRVGASDPGDLRLRHNLEKFGKRHGEGTVPLDVRLHSVADTRFDELVSSLGEDAGQRFDLAKSEYREWKKCQRDAFVRYPGAQRGAWDVLRMVTPLLPVQVQMALRMARTAMEAFNVIKTSIEAISGVSRSENTEPQLTKKSSL